MRIFHTSFTRLQLALLFSCCAAAVCAAQGPPSVTKVEPPNWWAGHSVNPVRVLVRGTNLGGARVEAVSHTPASAVTANSGVGIRTGLLRASERGTYLFLDVHV